MTLTLATPVGQHERCNRKLSSDDDSGCGTILFVDVSPGVVAQFPERVRKAGKRLTHEIHGAAVGSSDIRFQGMMAFYFKFHDEKLKLFFFFSEASSLLWKYRESHLVITTRIHVALPCVARGVPVIFIRHSGIFQGSLRVEGLTPLFHNLDLTKIRGKTAVQDWMDKFDFENPPPNPNFGKDSKVGYQLIFEAIFLRKLLKTV